MSKSKKITNETYKGVRDFYPEDQYVQEYIFFVWQMVLESFGYEKYDASILESSELYKAKSGEEIVNEQTYNFTDRGGREVTLRPEMTPTIARMVSKKRRELNFPLRWYSIPNLFRYERPQRGRLREHWQLNADIFGVKSIEAEAEVIEISSTILRTFGLNDDQFEIKINDVSALSKALDDAGLSEIEAHGYRKLLDKKEKMPEEEFKTKVKELLGKDFELNLKESESVKAVISKLNNRGISNVVFSPNLVRGFDYYTGVVFEVFSKDSKNNRSLFGGGRYDELLSIFDEDKIPAIGFGMGDVTAKDVLETFGLLPGFESPAQIALCSLNDSYFNITSELAQDLRKSGLNVWVDFSEKKIGEQISKADKKGILFVICIGEDEVNTDKFKIKQLQSGTEKTLSRSKIAEFVKKNLIR